MSARRSRAQRLRCRRWILRYVPLLFGCALLSLTARAQADVDKTERTKDGDYYVFLDDLLHSDVTQPFGENIRVNPKPRRVTLIRPRTSFVMEMFKSLEGI